MAGVSAAISSRARRKGQVAEPGGGFLAGSILRAAGLPWAATPLTSGGMMPVMPTSIGGSPARSCLLQLESVWPTGPGKREY